MSQLRDRGRIRNNYYSRTLQPQLCASFRLRDSLSAKKLTLAYLFNTKVVPRRRGVTPKQKLINTPSVLKYICVASCSFILVSC